MPVLACNAVNLTALRKIKLHQEKNKKATQQRAKKVVSVSYLCRPIVQRFTK